MKSLAAAGKPPARLSDPADSLNGALLTLSGSDSPNDVAVSFLSEMLETGELDPRYYLSPRACHGILRRATERGKTIPTVVRSALEHVAASER